MSKLMTTPGVKNPSAWVAKAAMAAGATASGAALQQQQQQSTLADNTSGQCEVDENASALLQTLSEDAQQEILTKLQNSWMEGKVQNPSAWVAKAALKAGATAIP